MINGTSHFFVLIIDTCQNIMPKMAVVFNIGTVFVMSIVAR